MVVRTDRRLAPRLFKADKPLVAARFMTVNGVELDRGDLVTDEALTEGMRMRLWLSGRAIYQEDFRPTTEAEAEASGVEPEASVERVTITRQGTSNWYVVKADWIEGDGEKISGKGNAEARKVELEADAPAPILEPVAPEQPSWEGFDDNPTSWTEEQRGVFESWYTSIPDGVEVEVTHPGVKVAWENAQKARAHDGFDLEALTDEERAALVTVVQVDEPEDTFHVKAAWAEAPEVIEGSTEAEVRAAELRSEGPPEGWTPPKEG